MFDGRGYHHDHSHRQNRYDDRQSYLFRHDRDAQCVTTRDVNDYANQNRDGERRERVDGDAAHDQLNVHQTVAHDRVAESEWDDYERED